MTTLTFERQGGAALYVGQSGAGKTRTMRAACRRQVGDPLNKDPALRKALYPKRKQIIVDYSGQFARWDNKGNHAEESIHRSKGVIYSSLDDWSYVRDVWDSRPAHIIQSPEIDLVDHIIPFCINAGGVNLWIDEVDDFVPKSGELNTSHPEFYELFHRSRHFGTDMYKGRFGTTDLGWNGTGCSFVVSVRRLANMHKDIEAKIGSTNVVYSALESDNHRLAVMAQQDKKEFHSRLLELDPTRCEFLRFDNGKEIRGSAKLDLHFLTDPG